MGFPRFAPSLEPLTAVGAAVGAVDSLCEAAGCVLPKAAAPCEQTLECVEGLLVHPKLQLRCLCGQPGCASCAGGLSCVSLLGGSSYELEALARDFRGEMVLVLPGFCEMVREFYGTGPHKDFFLELQPGRPISGSALEYLSKRPALLTSLCSAGVLLQPKLPQSLPGNACIQRAQTDLQHDGLACLGSLLHPLQLAALSEYHDQMFLYLGGGFGPEDRHGISWNDEPVSRMLQHQLTEFVSMVCGRRCYPSGLPLTLWYTDGPGFVMHADSSPPFDVTLDLCVSHRGQTNRPVTFLRPSLQGCGADARSVSCKPGEAVLFRGAEMWHHGGSADEPALPPGSLHVVTLFTWFFGSDAGVFDGKG